MKKKLLVTASTFPRWANDTEPKFIYDLCMQLKKYYDVTALVPAAPNAKSVEQMEGITVKRFQYFPIPSLQTLAYPGAIVPRIKEKKARGLLVPFFFIAQYFATRRELKHCDAVLVNWVRAAGRHSVVHEEEASLYHFWTGWRCHFAQWFPGQTTQAARY